MPTDISGAVNQVSAIGLETTKGVVVPVTRRLQAVGLQFTPGRNVQEFRPRGAKYTTGHAETRRWSEGTISDGSGLAYNEVPYIFNSLLSKSTPASVDTPNRANSTAYLVGDHVVPVPANGHVYRCTVAGTTAATQPAGYDTATTLGNAVVDGTATFVNDGTDAGNAYLWTNDTATYLRDNPATYTVETGDEEIDRLYQVAYAYFTGCEISSERMGEVGISGDLVGNQFNRDFTPTDWGTLLEAEMLPATPAHLNIYMDDSSAAIGTTLLDGNFTMTWNLSDKRTQVYFHRRDRIGASGDVETVPSATCEFVQADGEEVDEMILSLEEGMRKFFRMEFVGPEIGTTGLRNMIQLDMAAKIGDSEDYDEENDVWAATVPFTAEHDGTFGRALRTKVRTNLGVL